MNLLWPILRKLVTCPTRTAVVDDFRTYSYAKLVMAGFYASRAIAKATKRPHVGIMLPTSGAFPVTLLGAWLAGKVAVPVNYLLAREEMRYVLKDADIDTLVTVDAMLEFIGGEEVIPEGIRILRLDKDVKFGGMPPLRVPPRPKTDDTAVILYTSGTSGRPKGVMLTHGNLASDVQNACIHAKLKSADKFLGVLPQFHSFGLTGLTLLPLAIGSTVIYTARFIPRKIVSLIEEHRPEVFMGVPSMYGALLSVKDVKPDTFRSVRLPISGGEPLPNATFDAFLSRFSMKILEGYGLTETSPVTHWATPEDHRLHSVGRPLPEVRQFIVDEQNRVLGPDQDGEILLSGPNVMKGYYKLPEQTADVLVQFDPGDGSGPLRTFRTGDIGRIDPEGFLYITGRKKEMLIIAGENVFPREIEEVLNKHEAVKDSAVIGKQDGMRGEVPIAFVEINEGATFDEGDLRNHCRQNLAQFKVPREIRVIEQLPRNPTGKILRRKLTA